MATRQKEKAAARNAARETRPHATAKYIRISPSKVRIVLNIIRGKKYDEAVAIVKNTPNFATESILKVLESAGANAENNLGLSKSDLIVAEAYADGGPSLKRYTPGSHGRAKPILKRTSHITIVLDNAK